VAKPRRRGEPAADGLLDRLQDEFVREPRASNIRDRALHGGDPHTITLGDVASIERAGVQPETGPAP
jgi:hypothetical protein